MMDNLGIYLHTPTVDTGEMFISNECYEILMKKIIALIIVGLLVCTSFGIAGVNTKELEEKKTNSIGVEVFNETANEPIGKERKIVNGNFKEKKECDIQYLAVTPFFWGPIFDGKIIFDWSDMFMVSGNGSSEEALLLDFKYYIFAFGMHHIYIEIYYLPFGKNLPEPWLHNFTFSEDCFIFLIKRFHIPIPLVGHGAAVESYLWIDNRLWDTFSTEIR